MAGATEAAAADGGDKKPVPGPNDVAGICKEPCEFCEPVTRGTHPPWFPPANDSDQTGLRVTNSLTGAKELFKCASGRRVHWYTCGPTVYDVAHMGHARAYLTFDILRRVMEDYFGYEVLYQINITDIDDKIILRARRNKLLDDYRAANHPFEEARVFAEAAAAAYDAKMKAKGAALEEPLPPTATPIEAAERDELKEVHKLKMKQWQDTSDAIAAAATAGDASALIAAAAEPIADRLDAELGSTVSDQSIFEAHARRYEREFLDDMAALGVRPPNLMTRVTEYVPETVAFVEGIVAKGLAYESNGSVYMDTEALKASGHSYRKLEPAVGDATESQMSEGEGVLGAGGDKRNKNDFALWKASKAGEPSWESPWGPGRPGWHIECSVMASATLGNNMDIHAGGSDLKFPHHDNELAQSEAYHGCRQWVNYFWHAGHLNIKGHKMSKSLKNFITIRQALEDLHHSPRQIRLMFLLQGWDKAMQYSDQTIGSAKATEKRLKDFFGSVKAARRADWLGGRTVYGEEEAKLAAAIAAFQRNTHAQLLDNFNTAAVMVGVLELVDTVNKYLGVNEAGAAASKPGVLLAVNAAMAVTRILRVFGVSEQDDFGMPLGGGGGAGDEGDGESREKMAEPFADAIVKFRDAVRERAKETKDHALLALCDRLRDTDLTTLGVRVEDPVGDAKASVWRLDDPATLLRELEERRAAQRAKEVAKARNRLVEKEKELDKMSAASVPPGDYFSQGKYAQKFSAFDQETGIPQKDAEGNALTKTALKAAMKDFEEHKKQHKVFQQRVEANATYLEDLRAQIAALQLEVGPGAEQPR